MSNYLFIPTVAILASLAAAYIVWREFHAFLPRYVKYYFALVAAGTAWSIASLVRLLALSPNVASAAEAVEATSVVATSSSVLLFFCVCAQIPLVNNSRWAKSGILAFNVLFVIIAACGLTNRGMVLTDWGYWPHPGAGFALMAAYALAASSLSTFIAVQMAMQNDATNRKRLGKLLLVAVILPIAVGFGVDVTFRLLDIRLPTLTVAMIGVMALLMAYTTVKHRVLELEPLTILKRISNHLHDIMLVTDHNDSIVFTNPAAETMFGKKEDFIGKRITDFVTPKLPQDSLDGERLNNLPVIVRPRADNESSMSLNVSRFTEGGRAFRIFMLRSMSQAERLAEQYRESTVELEQRETKLAKLNHEAVTRELEIVQLKKRLEDALGR